LTSVPTTSVRPCRELSLGERTRAVLALTMAARVNCPRPRRADEPPRHPREELERSIVAFRGQLLLATHDWRLLERAELTRRVDVGSVVA
jgi:ATPase subunit of ABC transporter with duplicated ATPase domains